MLKSERHDQATTLRQLMQSSNQHKIKNNKIRVISVTSGKGGVGKTNVVANLAHSLAELGKKVLIFDGDFGLANLNILLNLDTPYSIHDVINGNKSINDVLLSVSPSIKLIPSSSGIFRAVNLSIREKQALLEKFESVSFEPDILLLDTGAGISSDVAYLNQAAHEVIVVTTPEPTALADAYAMMKVMCNDFGVKRFKLLVNMVDDSRQGLDVYNHLLGVTDKFLKTIAIEYIGHIIKDKKVQISVMNRKVVTEMFPESLVSSCIKVVARNIAEDEANVTAAGNMQFFWKTLLHEVRV